MSQKSNLEKTADGFPEKPGIYFFKDSRGRVIYIGKARSLRNRVRSYFSVTSDRKVKNILCETERIDFILTDSEREAAFLENNFIRQHQPKFNLRLKDDKNFPYLKMTIRDDYPHVELSRRVEPDGARYFGPFNPARQARKIIYVLNRYFGIRSCKEDLSRHRKRACLEYDIKQCSAPCTGRVTLEEYRERVRNALLLLEGKVNKLIPQLRDKMEAAAAGQDFEQAAHWRDLIHTLEQIKDKPKLISVKTENADIFGFHHKNSQAAVFVFHMREGRVVESSGWTFTQKDKESKESILAEGIRRHYLKTQEIPRNASLPFSPARLPEISAEIKDRTGIRIEFQVPQKGRKKRLVELAAKNAAILLEKETSRAHPLHQLQERLDLPEFPSLIEGIDVSNTSGEGSVGSLVVFQDGQPRKDLYRKYKIRTVTGPDDVHSIAEVVTRRYSRLQRENRPLPNLILIDGGKGQLSAARASLEQLGLGGRPLISLAKREETIYRPGRRNGVQLDLSSPPLLLLRHIRDEAHRFAVTYHRWRRSQKSLGSLLDHVPGIGARRKSSLLKKYRGLEEIQLAPEEDLRAMVGKTAARNLKEKLNRLDTTSS